MGLARKYYIFDASIIIKWVGKEEAGRKEAFVYLDKLISGDIGGGVPSICFYEVCNAMGIKQPEAGAHLLNKLLNLRLNEYALSLEITCSAFEIMKSIPKVAFYDAVYHALAIIHKGTFLTADKSYFDKAKKLKHIQLIG